ncbi:MAG: L,D-transpeptidase family protein [Pseudomonadota bacterium]
MSGHRISIANIATERFWQVAVLAAAGAIGLASPAEASRYYRYYGSDYEPGYVQSRPAPVPRRPQRVRPRQAKKVELPKDSVKPQGPLTIAISIERQTLKVYDANGFFAESPVSTGTKGHPTPMGVFSIIQKRKFHRSNIYSGAPMPFMQRITWSGIAMHAGALPGYPASHGCIRMPMAFAARMWNWTRMGARVIVTSGEITPARFSHPLLAEQKVAPPPQPTVTIESDPDAPPAAKADKGAGATVKPAISEASLELRSTVGHDGVTAVEAGDSRPLRDQTRTADASGANAAITMTDASSSAAHPAHSQPRDGAEAGAFPLIAADAAAAGVGDTPVAAAKAEAATAGAAPAAANPDQINSSDAQSVETKPSEAAIAEIKPADAEAADKTEKKPDEPPATSAQASGDAVKAATTESAKSEDSVTAATDPRPTSPEVKKDQTRLPDAEKAVVAKPEPPKPAGRIAVLVSRKDGKLYVRENFKPLFEVPVTIAPSERLLGTHVFTAQVDKDDTNLLRWSVVSLPVSARNAQKRGDDERSSRRRKMAGVVPAEVKQPLPLPNSPAEALDRITIPPEAMARIAEALGTGGSIVVSDHGINQGGETGEGTDFIVPLR